MRMIHYGMADITSGEGLTPIVFSPVCGRIRILSVRDSRRTHSNSVVMHFMPDDANRGFPAVIPSPICRSSTGNRSPISPEYTEYGLG